MHIKQIEIENFKILESIVIPFKQINIIVGKNNTGKTSILDAISLVFDDSLLNSYNRRREFGYLINYKTDQGKVKVVFESSTSRSKTVVIEHLTITDITAEIKDQVRRFASNINKKMENLKKEGINKSKEMPPKTKELDMVKLESFMDDFINKLIDNKEIERISKESIIIKRKKSNYIYFSNNFFDLILKLKEQIIETFISESSRYLGKNGIYFDLIESWPFMRINPRKSYTLKTAPIFVKNPIESLFTDRDENTQLVKIEREIEEMLMNEGIVPGLSRFGMKSILIKDEKGEHAVPMREMGDGFKALIGLIRKIKIAQKKQIILLEEPEVHMHPGYLMELARYITEISNKIDVQFFISTHSLDLIQYFLDNDVVGEDNTRFLNSNLEIVRLIRNLNNDKTSSKIRCDILNYEAATNEFNELKLDLRGI